MSKVIILKKHSEDYIFGIQFKRFLRCCWYRIDLNRMYLIEQKGVNHYEVTVHLNHDNRIIDQKDNCVSKEQCVVWLQTRGWIINQTEEN
jgi:hypothetical protein